LEPGAEAPLRVEALDPLDQPGQHGGADLVGVGVVEAQPAAPGADQGLVAVQEGPPGAAVAGVAEPLDERQAGGDVDAGHEWSSLGPARQPAACRRRGRCSGIVATRTPGSNHILAGRVVPAGKKSGARPALAYSLVSGVVAAQRRSDPHRGTG